MSAGYDLSFAIATEQTCPWTTTPDASWIAMSTPQSGSGPATVRFRVSDNWEAPRTARLLVRWPTPSAGQNVVVSQAGCRYAVSTTAIAMIASGGSGQFDVLQQSDPLECGGPLQDACLWTAESSAPWLTITSSMPKRGDDRVSFVVAANDGAQPRTASITVRDKVVIVTQAGR